MGDGKVMVDGMPPALRGLAGAITDVDTHEMLPAELWANEFGPAAHEVASIFLDSDQKGYWSVPGIAGDVEPITAGSIWEVKGPRAPGAIDPRRRVEVMDTMAVRRQLMFPTSIAQCGAFIATYPAGSGFFDRIASDRRGRAEALFEANNAWALSKVAGSDRVRPVPVAFGATPGALIDRTEALLGAGARAVMVLSSVPPGGRSPAHPDLDPFYALLTSADAALTVHIGSEGGFLASDLWRQAPFFDGYKVSGEFTGDPWTRSAMHLAAQNFTATLVTGGVFDRHPGLRFGAIELGAHWVGPLAEQLDLWADHSQSFSAAGIKVAELELRPSDYFRRNIRVTPYIFEPVDVYLDRHGLSEVYCYSSDYPHVEGGRDPMGTFLGRLERFGTEVVERFFVTNGAWLLPD